MNIIRHISKPLCLSLAGLLLLACQEKENGLYRSNRAPLSDNAFIELPLGAIQAQGWLEERLIRQRDGLTGHLDSIYPAVMGNSNGWLGGEGDQWERGPYWIDRP